MPLAVFRLVPNKLLIVEKTESSNADPSQARTLANSFSEYL